ncbi:MAG: hypothetical protein AAF862_04540, partial [Pseudomonadota bacterium]
TPQGFLLGITSPMPLFYTAFTSGVLGTSIAAGIGFLLLALQTPAHISGGGYFVGLCLAPLFVAWWLERANGFVTARSISGKVLGDMLSIIAVAGSLIVALVLLTLDRALAVHGGLVAVGQQFLVAIIDEFAAGSKMKSSDVALFKDDLLKRGQWLFSDIGARWLLFMTFAAGIAARMAKRSGKFGGANMRALSLPQWFAIPLLGSVLLSLAGGATGFVMSVIAMTLGAAAALHGMSVVHAMSRGLRLRPLILGSIYAIWMVYFPAGILLALLGVTDSRMNLRSAGPS